MFENNQNTVEELLKKDKNFRRLYSQHQQLHKRVEQAETGSAPMTDMSLSAMKKEKLMTKDHLVRMMDSHLDELLAV